MAAKAENNNNRILGWLGIIGVFLLTKIKWVFALFKIGKFATLATMFISLWAYAVFYGWKFAVAIIYLIFIHEMGHLVAAKMKKIPTSPAVFIPFLGAAIGIDPKKIKNAETEFFVAYGGPLAGLISTLPPIVLYFLTNDPYWALVVQLGALINLFNLFPVSPLDGGRIVSVLSTKIWFIGLIVLIPILFISPDPILILVFIFGLFTWWGQMKEHTKVEVLKQETKVIAEINNEIQSFSEQSFETPHIPNYNEITLNDIMNNLRERRTSVHHLIQDSKPSTFLMSPTKRLQRKKWMAEEEILERNFNDLSNIREFHLEEGTPINMGSLLEKNNNRMKEKRQELNRIKTYYQSSKRTKIKSLILYLGLAILLASLLVFAMDILEAAQLSTLNRSQ